MTTVFVPLFHLAPATLRPLLRVLKTHQSQHPSAPLLQCVNSAWICVGVLCRLVLLHASYLQMSKEGIRSPETEATDGYKHHVGMGTEAGPSGRAVSVLNC